MKDKNREVAYNKEWRAKNRKHVNEYARNWSKTKESEATKQYRKEQSKQWIKENREIYRDYQLKYRARKLFNLSLEEYKILISKPKCAIEGCNNKPNGIDHNHKTGQVRDALCQKCNLAYGLLEESRERIIGLLEYHDKWHLKKEGNNVQQ